MIWISFSDVQSFFPSKENCGGEQWSMWLNFVNLGYSLILGEIFFDVEIIPLLELYFSL